ncbi:MAG: hypothetical protein HDR18_12745 [Lachnospiraceae bacterium]|nr:hypothetical protein [Lachnospiraceae bacterium]
MTTAGKVTLHVNIKFWRGDFGYGCIVLIRGCDPVIDFKFNTFKHPMFKRSGDGEGKWYIHHPEKKKNIDVIDKETVDRLKEDAGEDGNVIITTITAEELIRLGNASAEKAEK